MRGSVQDAEDRLQETLLAAWRGMERFDGRSSRQVWLYRTATNRCRNALRDKRRRPRRVEALPEPPEPTRRSEPIWLEPYPDALLGAAAGTRPGGGTLRAQGGGLAGVCGRLQQLPPRHRAVLVLRHVLGFRAAEVAEMLETSEAAVKAALQRARHRLPARTRCPRRIAASRAKQPRSGAESSFHPARNGAVRGPRSAPTALQRSSKSSTPGRSCWSSSLKTSEAGLGS
jgi:DNA-directed RNA polymerase specialized sigma24 family protein